MRELKRNVCNESILYWLDHFSDHEGLADVINSCSDKEKEELNHAIMEIMNAANDLKQGHSLTAFFDCLMAGGELRKIGDKLRKKSVWYKYH